MKKIKIEEKNSKKVIKKSSVKTARRVACKVIRIIKICDDYPMLGGPGYSMI